MPPEPTEYPIVDEPVNLQQVFEGIECAQIVALDTEFVRERTYYPELCLVQIATDEIVAAIDCRAEIDLDPLFERLLARDKAWLLHSARQDLEILYYRTGRLPDRLIDTQIAAALTGLPAQIGLQALLAEVQRIDIGKQHTRADWSKRPLTEALKQYALDDVRYLHATWQTLQDRLEALNRLAWFEEDCARQLAVPIEPDTATLLDKVKGSGSLRGKNRAAAWALVEWREATAKSRNRPRRWILADDQLVRTAVALPQDMTQLKAVRDLPPRLIERSGPQLLEALAQAGDVEQPASLPTPDRNLVKRVQAAVRKLASDLDIQPELLATRRDIARMAAMPANEGLPAGWRGQVLREVLGALKPD